MKILISAAKVPYMYGGAEIHVNNLYHQMKKRGYDVEVVWFPLKFVPEEYVMNMMDFLVKLNFNDFHGMKIDMLISLQFPTYYVHHDNKVIWLIHQHRAVYDIFNESEASTNLKILRKKCLEFDNEYLRKAKKIFTISKNVTKRLGKFNKISSIPLYHPPLGEEYFYCEKPYDYVFYPSRLELLKRQDLLIKAMALTKSPVKAIIAGDGGQKENFEDLINEYNLNREVKIIDFIHVNKRDFLYKLYARSLAVFFGPKDEDYGYITLEAMLSSKPVITCSDSGGPLEFIKDNETGFIVESEPKSVAEKIDWIYYNKKKSAEIGAAGKEQYLRLNISWDDVVEKLVE